MNIEEGFRLFLEKGYRPTLKSHLTFYWPELVEKGYATFAWTDMFGEDQLDCIGWVIDAQSVRGDQYIIGATCPTIESALEYSLKELDKYAGLKSA